MAYFDRSLNAFEEFFRVMTDANTAFLKKRSEALERVKEPTKIIGEAQAEFVEIEKEQQEIFFAIVQEEFDEVRSIVNNVVTAAPPSDFMTTLEAIRALGNNITDYQASAFLEKYKGNFLAYSTIHEVLTGAGKKPEGYIVNIDSLAKDIDAGEATLIRCCREWAKKEYMTRALQYTPNPITSLAERVQEFVGGRFTVEETPEE